MDFGSLIDSVRSITYAWTREQLVQAFIETIITFVVLWLIQRIVSMYLARNVDDVVRRHEYRSMTRTILGFIALVILAALWLPSGQVVLQVLALLAAGLALTLSRPLTSLLGWVLILTRMPLRVGDRIEAGGVRGDIVDIGPMQLHLMELGNWIGADQSTGRIVHLPNSVIFDGPVYNYTDVFNLIWNEIQIVVTHDSDWEAARSLLLVQAEPFYKQIETSAIEGAREMGRRYAYQRGITTPFVYVDLLRDGIRLTLRYLTPPRRRRGSAHDITTGFLRAIAGNPDIQLAPPSYRVLINHEAVGSFNEPPANDKAP